MIVKLIIYILPWNWKIRVTFAMAAPKIIFRFYFFVALCASDIVPSKVCFNIFCCCKALNTVSYNIKEKKITFLFKFIEN